MTSKNSPKRVLSALCLLLGVGSTDLRAASTQADIVVYDGTRAGVIAAVQASRMGKSVAIVCPGKHLGGPSSGGLGYTDTGDKSVIGGLAREFYQRIWKHYQQPGAWGWRGPARQRQNRGWLSRSRTCYLEH